MSSLTSPIAFCKVSSVSEPSINCFGPCQTKFHLICLGIPMTCIEKFRDPMSGFKYICSNCRDISLASIFDEFDRMEMNFNALQTKILNFQRSPFKKVDGSVSDNSSSVGPSAKRNANEMDELTVPVSKKHSTRSFTRARAREVAGNKNRNNVAPTSVNSGSIPVAFISN
ncbi:hypothetical protein ACFFRR_007411 [Megaselia abdita]